MGASLAGKEFPPLLFETLTGYPMKKFIKIMQPIGVFLYFCAATVFMTYPLAFHLTDSVLVGMGDNIYFVWLIRWYQKVFLEGQGHPFFNPWMNYPQGWNLSTTDTTLSSALPGVPFSVLWGPIAGYNMAMFITFVLAGIFMYLWIRHLTHSEAAALLAGTIFAFAPNHIAHFLAGHLNLCGIEWFPLFFWGLYELLKVGRRLDWRYILLTGLALGAIAFTSMYYLYMTLLFSGVLVLAYLLFTRFTIFKNKYFWFNLILAGLISAPFLYYSLRPFVTLSSAGGIASRSMEYAAMYSASPTDFFLPSSDHFIFGAILGKFLDRSLWNETSLYIGLVGLIFMIVALVRSRRSQYRWLIWSGFVVIVASFILALGINLHWNNQNVVWQIPAFLQPLFHKTETLIYLPSAWLFTHLPFYNKMRALARFGLFALIFVPVLAALGFDSVRRQLSARRGALLSVCVILFVFFEFYPGSYAPLLYQPQPRSVDLWLAQQPGEGAVVEMPFGSSANQGELYYTLFYNKPFLGGFFNANKPEQWSYAEPIMANFPDEHSVELLKRYKVQYIIIDLSQYTHDPNIEGTLQSFGLVKLTQQENESVYTFGN
jgi:hypothetical protein